VDHNPVNRRILGVMLDGWLMKPVLVGGGREGIAAMQESKMAGRVFPLVLLDAEVPDVDGCSVAEEIRKDPDFACASIVMLTSPGWRRDPARSMVQGISAYLRKPVSRSELLEVVRATLGNPAIDDRIRPDANEELARKP
jgi:CheY-like chemotaxis protein